MNRLPERLTTPRRTPSRSTTQVPWPGWLRRKFAGRRMRSVLVEVGVDLAVAVGVVAERDHVDAGREQLVGDLRRDPDAAGGVLAVDDDEVRRVALAQARAAAPAASGGRCRRRRRRRTGASCHRLRAYCCGERSDEMSRPRAHRREPAARAEPTAPPPGPRARRWSCPRWVQLVMLPIGLLALWALARAAGTVLLVFLVAGGHRADPQPAGQVRPAAGAASRAASRCSRCISDSSSRSAGVGVLLANPVTTRCEAFQHDVPKLVDDANRSLADVQSTARQAGHQRQDQEAGRDRAADAAAQGRGRHQRHRRLRRGPADARSRGRPRADPRPRDVDLHAALRRADRRRGAAGDAAGRRHARRTTTRCACRRRSRATCAGSCCSAW